MQLQLTVNGKFRSVETPPQTLLVQLLREPSASTPIRERSSGTDHNALIALE